MKLIPLDAVLAEIERRKEKCELFYNIALSNNAKFAKVAIEEQKKQFDSFMEYINTLDVKEVDLVKEYDKEYFNDPVYGKLVNRNAGIGIAKHFFELGVNASNPLTWEDMRELHIILISLDMDIELSRSKLQKETLGYYEEVLKQFKAKKGS